MSGNSLYLAVENCRKPDFCASEIPPAVFQPEPYKPDSMKNRTAPVGIFSLKGIHTLFCFFLFGNVSSSLQAVENPRLPDIRSVGMGRNGATESVLCNPSLIALSRQKSIRIQYFNLYDLKELNRLGGSFQYPNPFLSTGVDISSFGYEAYRENNLRVVVGKSLSERWAMGIGLRYAWLQTPGPEPSASCLSADIGLNGRLVENLLIGLLIQDLPSFQMGNKTIEYKSSRDFCVQIGFQWEVINSLLIVGTLGGSNERKIQGNAGFEYTVWQTFHLRAGLQTAPLLPSFGIGYDFSRFTLDIAGVYHSVLGIQTGIGLSFSF